MHIQKTETIVYNYSKNLERISTTISMSTVLTPVLTLKLSEKTKQ